MKRRERESGQILVIFAGGLVVLLAIAALVLDVGQVLAMKRQGQNAVDPGAIAAARYIRPTADTTAMQAAACWYARQNGFFQSATTNTGCIPANDSLGSTLTVNFPPSSSAGTYAGRPGFVEVVISSVHKSWLAGVLGRTQFAVTASAVAAYSNGNSNSNSLVSLNPGSKCSTGKVSGNGTVRITASTDPATGQPYDGGYVYVNSSCSTGSPDGVCAKSGQGALDINGSNATLVAPKVYTNGTCVKANNATFTNPLTEGAVQIGDPLADLPAPSFGPPGAYCGGTGPGLGTTDETTSNGCTFNNKNTTYDLQPGVYYGGWKITGSNVTLHLNPGIYVIAGGGISLGATGTITSVAGGSGSPAPVMIFSTDNPKYSSSCLSGGGSASRCQGDINFTAGSDLLLSGLTSGPYKGILVWQDGDGSGAAQPVKLAGQGSLTLSGTVYAPKSLVTIDGGSSSTGYAAVQVIAWEFVITGSGTLTMPYDPTKLYQFDQLGLVK